MATSHGYWGSDGQWHATSSEAEAVDAWRTAHGYKSGGIYDVGNGRVVDTREVASKRGSSNPATTGQNLLGNGAEQGQGGGATPLQAAQQQQAQALAQQLAGGRDMRAAPAASLANAPQLSGPPAGQSLGLVNTGPAYHGDANPQTGYLGASAPTGQNVPSWMRGQSGTTPDMIPVNNQAYNYNLNLQSVQAPQAPNINRPATAGMGFFQPISELVGGAWRSLGGAVQRTVDQAIAGGGLSGIPSDVKPPPGMGGSTIVTTTQAKWAMQAAGLTPQDVTNLETGKITPEALVGVKNAADALIDQQLKDAMSGRSNQLTQQQLTDAARLSALAFAYYHGEGGNTTMSKEDRLKYKDNVDILPDKMSTALIYQLPQYYRKNDATDQAYQSPEEFALQLGYMWDDGINGWRKRDKPPLFPASSGGYGGGYYSGYYPYSGGYGGGSYGYQDQTKQWQWRINIT